MKAEELYELFDKGEDITPYLDLSTTECPGIFTIKTGTIMDRITANPQIHFGKPYGDF